MLDTCRTVAEAQRFLERIPHLGNTTYLVADAAGDIAAVEASPRRVVTTRFPDGFGFLANRYVSEEMAAGSTGGEVRGSAVRSRNIRRWSESRPRIGLEDIQHVLADPNDGVCVTRVGLAAASEDPDVTLWSWVAALDRPVLSLARGMPSETPYEPAAL